MDGGVIASTAALWGLAGGDIASALTGAAAPELAYFIGHKSGPDEDDVAARAIAHAILGGRWRQSRVTARRQVLLVRPRESWRQKR